jgi:two-component system LytT family sensor kinase
MDALHGSISPVNYFVGELIGYTTGLVLTVLLLVMTLRAARLPGTPFANIGFAACALFWVLGGLASVALQVAGFGPASGWPHAAYALKYTGAAASPIPILAMWSGFAAGPRRRLAARVLFAVSCVSAFIITALLWLGIGIHAPQLTAYHAALFLLVGAAISVRRASTPRSVYHPSLVMVAAACGALVTMNPHVQRGGWVTFAGSHFELLVVLGAFLLFARFRYADQFIRFGVRILLAGFWASVVAFSAESVTIMRLAHGTPSPPSFHVFAVILIANAVLLSFTFIDDRISNWLNRWLFRAPDFRACLKQFGDMLRQADTDAEIAADMEAAARNPLELNSARVVALDDLPPSAYPPGIVDGDLGERDLEVWIPIASAGRIGHALVAEPGPARPALVTHDLNYLRAVAAQSGIRMDALRREREAIELQSREALLQQQVSEAELRALRAQINPHFLFNSLNTIADLVVRNPARAEAMTLRLASVFRHVLANSARPLTPLRDEIEFLRTYLHIEEARFGDRLTVGMDIAPDVAGEPVPSLILQPLVENALKHGLAPKPEPGHLWISARGRNGQVCIHVEDDGMGPGTARAGASGVGLANVAERLATLYQDRASVKLEPREGGGSRVTVLIPRGAPAGEP